MPDYDITTSREIQEAGEGGWGVYAGWKGAHRQARAGGRWSPSRRGPTRLHPDLHLTWLVLSRETPTSPLTTDPALNGKGWSGDGQWQQRHIKGFRSGSQGSGAVAQEGPPQLGEQWAGYFLSCPGALVTESFWSQLLRPPGPRERRISCFALWWGCQGWGQGRGPLTPSSQASSPLLTQGPSGTPLSLFCQHWARPPFSSSWGMGHQRQGSPGHLRGLGPEPEGWRCPAEGDTVGGGSSESSRGC